ncbi:hypothetical protein N7519_011292 [Penicillium mononematosum]|uniref:uncharacterized protein n=1 Tax=Penicillium mononematosum TaxID=268346 RepID=UPI002548B409|nr:uncharacterized protein N7519_011292 [Penicillium mononematosum]KAJ6180831.1 hypothetical protein N7519_011292 [Penicillium mononematosum]
MSSLIEENDKSRAIHLRVDELGVASKTDILVPSCEDTAALFSFLAADKSFSNESGQLRFQHSGFSPSLDILTIAVEAITFEQARPYCLNVEEVKVLRPDYSLAMKVQCFCLRQDDGQRSELISDDCAEKFKFGYYHLLELRQELGAEHIANFIRVGGRKLMLPWNQNSEDQKEYFSCFAEPGADPFTVELEER